MIGDDRPPAALAHLTGYLMNWVGTRSRRRFLEVMGEVGLHPRDFAVLNVIAANPGSAQQQLTHATHVDASTMVALLDGLETKGLAERRPHPEDRRKRAIHLTAEGERLLRDARGRAGVIDEETFGDLTREERAELLRLLQKAAGIGEPGASADPSSASTTSSR